MLGADVAVVQLPGLFLGQHHDPAGLVGEPLEHVPGQVTSRRPT